MTSEPLNHGCAECIARKIGDCAKSTLASSGTNTSIHAKSYKLAKSTSEISMLDTAPLVGYRARLSVCGLKKKCSKNDVIVELQKRSSSAVLTPIVTKKYS